MEETKRSSPLLTFQSSSPPILLIPLISLLAFLITAILSAQIFEHVPHSEDEVAYFFQAKVFAFNHLTVPTPPYAQAFWTPFVVDYQGQRFGKYPPGWPLLLSLGVRLGAPWLVNSLLASLTLALIAWLGYCLYPATRSLGLWAAGLGLVTPGFLFLSSSLLSHTASLFWSTLALVGLYYTVERGAPLGSLRLWCVVRSKLLSRTTHHAPRTPLPASRLPLPALLTGLALGAAFVTRPFAGVGVGLAAAIFLLVRMLRREVKWTVLLWMVLGGLPVAALLPLYQWAISGDPFFNPYLLVWPYDRVGFRPDIGPYGYTLVDAIFINTRLKLMALATGLFGWPGWTNLLFLPIPFLARRVTGWDWLLLGTLAGLVLVHTFYWAFGGTDGGFPRYYYDVLPALLLLTVRGIQISGEYLACWSGSLSFGSTRFFTIEMQRHSEKKFLKTSVPSCRCGAIPVLLGRLVRAKFFARLPLILVISFTLYNLIWNLPPLLAAQKGKYGITAAQLQTVERANLAESALIIVKNVDEWSDFAAPFAANSPLLDGPVVYAIDRGADFTQKLRAHFSERRCWELTGEKLKLCP